MPEVPDARVLTNRLQFSLRVMLVLFIPVALLAGLTVWLLYPTSPDVRIEVMPFSLPRYDNHAGNLPLGAVVRITNLSRNTAWYLGYRGTPVYQFRQLVDGTWESVTAWHILNPLALSEDWTPLRPMESVTFLAGAISEEATEFRVAVPFTTERLAPTKAHWVFSPAMQVVKRGQEFFPEPKPGAQQEVQVLSLR